MKKTLVSLLVLMIASTSFAFPSAQDARGTFRNGYAWGGHSAKDRATQWAQGVEGLGMAGGGIGKGGILYVDSAVAGTSGRTWADAVGTINAAIDLSSAYGWIFVAEGHNEALAASGADADVVGLTIEGKGRGASKPTLDYDAATGTFDIGAADVTLINLRFRCSITGVVSGIDIQAGGDNAQIIGCEFGYGETQGTDEFLAAISVHQGASNVLIRDCWFNSDEAGAAEAIRIGCVSGIRIENNTIFGDYSVGGIVQTVSTASGTAGEVFIRNNTISIGEMKSDGGLDIAQPAIELIEGTAGWIADNRIASDVATALLMIVADDCIRMNNIVTDTDGDEFSGTIEAGWSGTSGSAGIQTVSSISGHNDG